MRTLLILCCLIVAGCTAPQGTATGDQPAQLITATAIGPEIRIDRVTPFPAPDNTVGITTEPFLLTADVSYPSSYGDNGTLVLTVNNTVTPFREVGGGYGGGRVTRTLQFYAGAPGDKNIVATYSIDGEPFATTPVNYGFVSHGDVLLLDRFDGETLFAAQPLRFLAYFAGEVQATLNGTPLALTAARLDAANADLLHECAAPAYVAGTNTLVVRWTGSNGQARERSITLLYHPGYRVPRHQPVRIAYGEVGSRSGPYFRLNAADSTTVTFSGNQQSAIFPVIEQGSLGYGTRLHSQATFLKPGPVAVWIERKGMFLLPFEPADTVTFSVE